jgi:hypothetical protein
MHIPSPLFVFASIETGIELLAPFFSFVDSAWRGMKKCLILTFFVQQMGYLIKKKVFLLSRMTGNVRL